MKLLINAKKKLNDYVAWSKEKDKKSRERLLFKRENYPTYISQKAKWRIEIIRKTKYFDKNQKDILLPKSRRFILKLSKLNLIEDRIFYFTSLLNGLMALAFILACDTVAYLSIINNPLGSGYVMAYDRNIGSIVIFFCLILYRGLTNFGMRKLQFQTKLRFTHLNLIISLAGIVIALSVLHGKVLDLSIYIGYSILSGIFGLSIIFYISVILDSFVSYLLDLFCYNKIPEGIVAHNAVLLLHELETHPEAISDLRFKKMAIARLNYIAEAISKNLPALLRSKDNEFNDVTKSIYQNMANAIKEKKIWVLTPKADTSQYLAQSLAEFLFHFINGDWDCLEKMNSPAMSLYGRWAKRYLPIFRPILAVGIPIAAYWVLKSSTFSGEPWISAVVGYLFLWIIINLVWLVDPSVKEKIGSFKDTAGLF